MQMIYATDEMVDKVRRLLADVESEIVEYKSAKNNFDSDNLGKYFSALSNEANLRHADAGWLLFGVRDDRTLCGTGYRKEGQIPSIGLRRLKHDIALHANNGMTFEEIYEIDIDGKRIVVFQIPPATFASPTTWRGIPWSRENESLVQMPQFKLEAIYSQSRPDWSRQIAYDATIDDLDSEAIRFACNEYVKRYAPTQKAAANLSHEDILSKIGLLIHEHITNAALVLLGKPEATALLSGVGPRITWTLYSSTGEVTSYEHFEPPFLLQVNKVLAKIRNEKYRFFTDPNTLFPEVAQRYSPEIIRELLHNAIAHQDYRLSGKINVLEYEDHLVFLNEGSFIPGSIDAALAPGYKPPYYRNALLAEAMSKIGMIDQNAIGIRNVFSIQRERRLPLPTYDLSQPSRISVTIFGTVIDEKYSQLLAVYPELDLQSVVLLDMVQKEQPITKSQAKSLRSLGLVEGRYPRLTISSSVAKALDKQREYVRSKGLDNRICKELILQLLRSRPSTRIEILTAIRHALPKGMTEQQQANRVSYLLQSLRKQGKISSDGATSSAKWHPQKDS
jgi:ATP-dependent DNA helicase RecG